jgi:hypothetical protein
MTLSSFMEILDIFLKTVDLDSRLRGEGVGSLKDL